MAAPQKPWEIPPNRSMANQRQASFHPDRGYPPVPGFSGGGFNPSGLPPPLPPRPANLASSSMSRSAYGGLNSLSTYGGYGPSMYGNYGYNRYGMIGSDSPDDNAFIHVAEESSRQAFQSIESIVHAFGSVSMMLESTYHAVYSSFRAVLGVAEHFSRMRSHFAQIFSALAIVRTLKWILKKLLYLIGLRSQDPTLEAAWRNMASGEQSLHLTEADLKPSRSSWPIVMFLGVVLGSPYVIWRLLSSLVPPKERRKSQAWSRGIGDHYVAQAKYSFESGNRKELPFQAGQYLILAPKDLQPQVRGWLLASNKRHVGFVPANYLKILQGPSQNPAKVPVSSNGRVDPRILPNISGDPRLESSSQNITQTALPAADNVPKSEEESEEEKGGVVSGEEESERGIPPLGQVDSLKVEDAENPTMPKQAAGGYNIPASDEVRRKEVSFNVDELESLLSSDKSSDSKDSDDSGSI